MTMESKWYSLSPTEVVSFNSLLISGLELIKFSLNTLNKDLETHNKSQLEGNEILQSGDIIIAGDLANHLIILSSEHGKIGATMRV